MLQEVHIFLPLWPVEYVSLGIFFSVSQEQINLTTHT